MPDTAYQRKDTRTEARLWIRVDHSFISFSERVFCMMDGVRDSYAIQAVFGVNMRTI